MIIVLSPAKSLDYESPLSTGLHSAPAFLNDSENLVDRLRGFSPQRLCRLMGISAELGRLNAERYAAWRTPFTPANARPAMFAFKGDVYLGLRAEDFSADDIDFAQQHLRILSGLYGVLRPLDLMQPYRLEMGTRLKNPRGADLYDYWGEAPSRLLNAEFAALNKAQGGQNASSSNVLVNLASNEYFKVLRPKVLEAEIITPVFKDRGKDKGKDSYRVVSFYAKKARGTMAAWLIRNRIEDPGRIAEFAEDGYRYHKGSSTAVRPVFHRRQPPPLASAASSVSPAKKKQAKKRQRAAS